MKDTKIEWAHHTFNPWIGCSKVSEGCRHCYAENLMDTRLHHVQWGHGSPRRRTTTSYWRQPLRWNTEAASLPYRPRVFCASLADVFDDEVPVGWLIDLLDLIDITRNLDWLLLTKRPENISPRMNAAMNGNFNPARTFAFHMPNVWLGVSAEDQKTFDERFGVLATIPAIIRFVSAEPLIGSIQCLRVQVPHPAPLLWEGAVGRSPDWIIVGGESGPKARPMDPAWVETLRVQADDTGTHFFFKQWGGTDKKAAGRLFNGTTHDALPCP